MLKSTITMAKMDVENRIRSWLWGCVSYLRHGYGSPRRREIQDLDVANHGPSRLSSTSVRVDGICWCELTDCWQRFTTLKNVVQVVLYDSVTRVMMTQWPSFQSLSQDDCPGQMTDLLVVILTCSPDRRWRLKNASCLSPEVMKSNAVEVAASHMVDRRSPLCRAFLKNDCLDTRLNT